MASEQRELLRRFIVFEGIDGAGTTTQLGVVDAALGIAGVPHWTTAEPTSGPVGSLIRRVLGGELSAAPGTVAHLFAADRCEHLYGSRGIVERLGRGEVVVCDRYVLSSLAYQGAACGPDLPLYLNDRFPLPSLLIFFDIDPRLSMARIDVRRSREIYELLPFQERVREAYETSLDRISGSPTRIVRVEASLPRAEVSRIVLDAIGSELGIGLRVPT
jgi:dTMP kinase